MPSNLIAKIAAANILSGWVQEGQILMRRFALIAMTKKTATNVRGISRNRFPITNRI